MSNAYCQSCGAVLESGAQFCKTCGTPVAVLAAASQTSSQQTVNQSAPPVYQQPTSSYTHYAQTAPQAPGSEPLSVGQYVGMMLLSGLPLVGFILLLVWAFGSEANLNKKNYSRAVLIIMLVAAALSIVFGIIMAGFMATMWRSFSN